MKLAGKKAVITGASQGLGRAIAEAFVREGADVLICARSATDVAKAAGELNELGGGRAHYAVCDIGRESDVEALAAEALAKLGGVDILVANAGVYGPKNAIDDVDWSAWTEAIQTNLIGTVYCCRTFLPALRKSARGKILIVSGGGATNPMPFMSAYAASKAGVVRFGETLAGELKDSGIDVNMIAPGALNTRMLDEVLAAGPDRVGEAFFRNAVAQSKSGGTSPALGAALCVYLASGACEGLTGRLISAKWDPWERFDELKAELESTDIYTIRRIIPEERGKNWGTN